MDKEFFLNFFCQKVCRCQKRLYLCSLLSQRGQRKRKPRKRKGSLAQLVQSVCLTSRGSGVRIPQLPQAKSFKIKASDSSGAFLFSRKNTICCIYVGVVVVTRGKGKNENRFWTGTPGNRTRTSGSVRRGKAVRPKAVRRRSGRRGSWACGWPASGWNAWRTEGVGSFNPNRSLDSPSVFPVFEEGCFCASCSLLSASCSSLRLDVARYAFG